MVVVRTHLWASLVWSAVHVPSWYGDGPIITRGPISWLGWREYRCGGVGLPLVRLMSCDVAGMLAGVLVVGSRWFIWMAVMGCQRVLAVAARCWRCLETSRQADGRSFAETVAGRWVAGDDGVVTGWGRQLFFGSGKFADYVRVHAAAGLRISIYISYRI